MHNKTVKRRVNRRIGGSPKGTKRKRESSFETLRQNVNRLLPKKRHKIYVDTDTLDTNPITEASYSDYQEEMGPAIASEYISDSDVSVYSDESGKSVSGEPLFVRIPRHPKKSMGDSKKRKDVGYKGKHMNVIVSMDDSSVGKKRSRKSPLDIERSKDVYDLPDRRVSITKKKKPGSLPNISKKAPNFVKPKNVTTLPPPPQKKIFSAPKNVPKPPPPPQKKIVNASKSSVPPKAPKKLPKRIVELRLYNYYRDKTLPNNKEDPNHYLDYICHIRCEKGFMYTIDSDIERTIISNGPVEFDFSYRCQHVPFNIKREDACKVCSQDFEVNADYFKYLEDHTQRHKGNEKKKYLEYVNSLTKEEDIYDFFLSLGNVIEFLTHEHSCDTTNVTYLDEEIDEATVDKGFYQIIDEDHANIFKEKDVFKSNSLNIKLEYKS
jgi:hypothetical protein